MSRYLDRVRTNYLILHAADTYARMDTTAADIDQWHRQRGFSGIGYHYVIRRDGTVENGRPDAVVGAHCRSKGRNRDSVGICLIGGRSDDDKPEDNFTVNQLQSLGFLIQKLKIKYPGVKVKGHRDFDPNKACPCFDYSPFA